MSSMSFPLIVKAGRSAIANPDKVSVRKGATVAWDVAKGLEAHARIRAAGLRVIVQRRIHPGQKINVCISRRNGSSEMRFAYRSLRQVQPSGAESAALESISAQDGPGAVAADALERVCDLAGYEGAANGQCVLAGDGTLYLIEVNPRLWSSTWFAEKMGQKAAERGVRLALGLAPLPEVRYSAGRRFHYLPSEWRWFVAQGGGPKALLKLISGNRPWDLYEGVDFSDPLPTLARLIR
jgi:predicted ATP-grasp superfamily ATP-dependent carboligase